VNKTVIDSPESRLYDTSQVRELDRVAIEEEGIPGLTLMKRAAQACVETLLARWPEPASVAVLCGSGNNAGDGFIIAGLLTEKGIRASVGLLGKVPEPTSDAGSAYAFCKASGADITGVDEAMADATVIVDALLGTGITGAVRPEYAEVISAVNESGRPVLAVDLPSGLCADTGSLLGECVAADVTVTFIGVKIGLLTNNGSEQAGEICYAGLGVPQSVYDKVPWVADVLDYQQLTSVLEPRHRNAHKISHGHLLVVGGNRGMAGAAAMAAEAALYSGAGMVTVATHPDSVSAIMNRRPEIMARSVTGADDISRLLDRVTGVVLGPGLGADDWSREIFQAVMRSPLPIVLDADGLNLLAENPVHRDNWILTPHPGEASRLLAADIPGEVQSDRLQAVIALQKKYGGVSLLKGAGTLIAESPIAEESSAISLCPYGNPGMSVAGMGDVLAGVIGGLLIQGLTAGDAVKLGATVHSLAADELVAEQGERGLLATELLPVIRRLVNP
jgi:NAD(P)H-hydrate epimerase